jgi:hypothetical protein
MGHDRPHGPASGPRHPQPSQRAQPWPLPHDQLPQAGASYTGQQLPAQERMPVWPRSARPDSPSSSGWVTAAQPGPGTSACSAAPRTSPPSATTPSANGSSNPATGRSTWSKKTTPPPAAAGPLRGRRHPRRPRTGARPRHPGRRDRRTATRGALVQLHRPLGQPARPLPGPIPLAIRTPASTTHRLTTHVPRRNQPDPTYRTLTRNWVPVGCAAADPGR